MIVFIAFIIGFLGYLNIGNINMSVVELSVSRRRLTFFLACVVLAEFLYCYFSLWALHLVINSDVIIFYTKWITVFLLTLLGVWCFFDAGKSNNELGEGIVKRGYFSAIIHPQQVSFWLLWGTILFQNGFIKHSQSELVLFSVFNSIGTLGVLLLYAYVGKRLYKLFNKNKGFLNKLAGIFSFVLAFIQLAGVLNV